MKNIQDHQKDSLTNTHLYIQNMICEHHFLSELAGTNINLTEIYTEITFNPYALYTCVYCVWVCVAALLLVFCTRYWTTSTQIWKVLPLGFVPGLVYHFVRQGFTRAIRELCISSNPVLISQLACLVHIHRPASPNIRCFFFSWWE